MSEVALKLQSKNSGYANANKKIRTIANRKPHLFITVFVTWGLALIWFLPRLVYAATESANGLLSQFALWYFVVFITIAWLYGIYNIAIVLFAAFTRNRNTVTIERRGSKLASPSVAVLYTTCNDFSEASALSCLNLDYENYVVYILDDSSDKDYIHRIDTFAQSKNNIIVIRRPNKTGFKAGNLNYALKHIVTQPYFVIADADEILPRNFLCRLVPQMEQDPNCGFIQANHCCSTRGSKLQKDMRKGIDIHWKWYQPLRNLFGFVMFLGHGAILRRSCWERVNGFPEVVSEDLAYAIAIREQGYYGRFEKDVTCLEEFPETVRSFRVRHVKWTRGTCEFLHHYTLKLLRSPRISWTEKLDILFPTANLPLTFFFFVFMIMTAIILPMTIGERSVLTVETVFGHALIPVVLMPEAMTALYTADFFTITIATILGPILCFILAMWKTPIKLLRFLANSTALYATLSPLSSICVLGYLFTRKARFLVTANQSDLSFKKTRSFWSETHPDSVEVRSFEIFSALVFFAGALISFQIALFGLAIGYAFLAIMHSTDWRTIPGAQFITWLPFTFIAASIGLGGLGIFGVQPVFFGFGFHF